MELYNDDTIIASAVIGKRKPNLLKRGEFGVYLRETDGYKSWLVSGNINASDGIRIGSAQDYLNLYLTI